MVTRKSVKGSRAWQNGNWRNPMLSPGEANLVIWLYEELNISYSDATYIVWFIPAELL